MSESLRILKPLLRGFPIVALVMVLCVVAAKKYLSYTTPLYESTAKLRLADISEGIPNSNLFKNFDVFASSNKIAAEIEVIKSNELLLKALKGLDFSLELYRVGDIRSVELYHDSPLMLQFGKNADNLKDKKFRLRMLSRIEFEISSSKNDSLTRGRIGERLMLNKAEVTVQLNDTLLRSRPTIKVEDFYEFELLSEEKQLEKINKHLDILAVDKDVPVIRLNYKSNIPQKASAFINKLAETYIVDYIENKYQAARTTVNFLDKQIEEAGDKLSDAENSIEEFRNERDIINIRQETETDLREISQLKIQQTNLKMNLDAIEELCAYVDKGKDKFLELAPNFEAFTDLLSTEIIKNIKKLQADKKDLLIVYTSGDEKVKVIDQKIKDLTSYLVESIKNTRNNLQVKYDDISERIETAEAEFEDVPEEEKNMNILTREFDLVQNSYNFLNEKRIEAQIAQSATIAFHRVISPAVPGLKPVSPNKPIIIIVFALLGMIGSIAAIYTVHFLKAKVNDTQSIEQNSSIPVAASTPFINQHYDTVFSRNLIQLELKGLLQKKQVLAFSSFGSNEGRGFNLNGMCHALSSQGREWLLLDVAGDLGALNSGRETKAGIFEAALPNGLYVNLSESPFQANSPEQLRALLDSFKTGCDFILINNAPLAGGGKALLVMREATHNLVVVDARKTPLKTISHIELLKEEYQLPDTWFMLNRAGYNPGVIKEVMQWFKKLKPSKK